MRCELNKCKKGKFRVWKMIHSNEEQNIFICNPPDIFSQLKVNFVPLHQKTRTFKTPIDSHRLKCKIQDTHKGVLNRVPSPLSATVWLQKPKILTILRMQSFWWNYVHMEHRLHSSYTGTAVCKYPRPSTCLWGSGNRQRNQKRSSIQLMQTACWSIPLGRHCHTHCIVSYQGK